MANDFSILSASALPIDVFGGSPATAHPLEAGMSVSGRIDSADDIDAFRFRVETGTLYTVNLSVNTGGRLSAALASTDQYSPPQSAAWNAGVYSWVAHASGVVNLSLSALEGMPAYTLVLAKAVDDIGSTRLLNRSLALDASGSGRIDAANDIDWFAVQLEAGQTYAFDYSGDSGAAAPLQVSLQRVAATYADSVNQVLVSGARFVARESGTYYVQASSTAVQSYTVKVSEQPDDMVGAIGTGALVPIGGARSARIDFAGDRDAFKLAVLEGHVYRISVDNREVLADASISGAATTLWNHDGRLGTSNQPGVHDYYVRADASGELLVTVDGRSTGAYSVAAVDVLTDTVGNGRSTALPLALGAFVDGVIDYGSDVDSYRVAVDAGVSYVATVTAGGSTEGIGVDFRSPTGVYMPGRYITPDISGELTLDVRGLILPDAPRGRAYTVSIAKVEDDYAANSATSARLLIGNTFHSTIDFYGDRDWVAMSLTAGRHYAFHGHGTNIELYDGSGARVSILESPRVNALHFTAPLSGTYFLGALHYNDAPGAYSMSASEIVAADDFPFLYAVHAGQTVNGKLERATDTDRFALPAMGDKFYKIELALFDASGAALTDTQDVLGAWMKSSPYIKTFAAGDGAAVFQTQFDMHLQLTMGGDARVASYRMTYSALAQDAERANADGIVVKQGASQGANLQVAGDSDVFWVTLLAGERVALTLRGAADGAGTLDLEGAPLALLRTDPQLLPGDVRYETGSSQRAIFTVPVDKTYAFDVGAIGRAGSYTVSLERIGIGMEDRSARAGNDWFDAKGWGAFIDGGAGIDTVQYQLNASEVTIGADAGARTVAWGDYQPDVLTGIERLYFAGDGSARAFDIDGVAGDAYRLYRAAFDRKPDDAGAGFWMYFLEHGMSGVEMAKGFMASPEFVKLYGTASSDLDFVQRLYSNVLHREGEQAGVDFYLDLLAGGVERAQVLNYFASSPENQQAVAMEIGQGFAYIPYG